MTRRLVNILDEKWEAGECYDGEGNRIPIDHRKSSNTIEILPMSLFQTLSLAKLDRIIELLEKESKDG